MKATGRVLISVILTICILLSNSFTLISFALDNETSDIQEKLLQTDYKGKLYETYYQENDNEFNYAVKKSFDIEFSDNLTGIKIDDEIDCFSSEFEEYSLEGESFYRFIMIPVKSFYDVLGMDGKIEFLDGNNESIGKLVNGNIKDDNYIFYFNKNTEIVNIKTSKPIQSGTLEFISQKYIKSSVIDNIDFEDLKDVRNIKSFSNMSYLFSEKSEQAKQVILDKNYVIGATPFVQDESRRFEIIAKQSDNEIKTNTLVEKESEPTRIENKLNLDEPMTNIDMTINEATLSTFDENKIDFNLTLKNSSYENELFDNPIIKIELPEDVIEASIDRVMILYKNGLSISNWNVDEEDGRLVLVVELRNTQTGYQNSKLIEGTNLIVETTIKVDNQATSKSASYKLKYTNADKLIDYEQENKDGKEFDVNIISKYGLVTLSGIQNLNNEEQKVISVGNSIKSIDLDMNDENQKLKYEMAILNNYTNCLENVEIYGAFPTDNNEQIKEENLKNTFKSTLLTMLDTEGVDNKVLYSDSLNPNADVNNWTENIEELDEINSYKIIIPKIEASQAMKFSYEMEIPENLAYNQSTYASFQVNYNYDGEMHSDKSIIGGLTEKKDIDFDECQIQENNDVLSIGTYASIIGDAITSDSQIFDGQYIDYYLVLTNNSKSDLRNVKIKANVNCGNFFELRVLQEGEYIGRPDVEFTKYFENTNKKQDEKEIELIKANDQIVIRYQVVARKNASDSQVGLDFDIKTSDNNYQISSLKNNIKDSNMSMSLTYGGTENVEVYSPSTMSLCLNVVNKNIENINNVDFELVLPNMMEIETDFTNSNNGNLTLLDMVENSNDKVYKFKLDSIEKGQSDDIVFMLNVDSFDLNIISMTRAFVCRAFDGENRYTSNYYVKELKQGITDFDVNFTSSLDSGRNVNDGDKIDFELEVENKGGITSNVSVNIPLPAGMDFSKATIYIDNKFQEELDMDNYKLTFDKNLEAGKILKINFSGIVNSQKYQKNQDQISLYAVINSIGLKKQITTKEISYYIDNPDKDDDNDTDENDVEENLQENDDDIIDNSNNNNNEENKEQENNKEDNKQENTNKVETDNTVKLTNKNETQNNNTNTNKGKNTTTNKLETQVQKPSSNKTENTSNNQVSKGNNSISGSVWLDKNKDGLIDSDEKKLSGITVKLFKTSIDLTKTDNAIATVKTSGDGKYKFDGLEDGKYIVLFEYDTSKYVVTKYSSNSMDLNNSKAIAKQIDFKEVAVTNILEVNNQNMEGINLGLSGTNNFDFSISKKISSVTVKNGKDDRTKNYTTEDLIKEEISSKYLAGTKVTVSYNITVKNTGDVPGYVNKVEDILPNGLDFDEKLNSSWQKSGSNLINTSLNNVSINPGETKNLKLVLTKTMTDDNTGTFDNTARIVVSSNSKDLKDSDSKNDSSKVTLIISVKTGGVVIISAITLVVLLIVGAVITIIKRKLR